MWWQWYCRTLDLSGAPAWNVKHEEVLKVLLLADQLNKLKQHIYKRNWAEKMLRVFDKKCPLVSFSWSESKDSLCCCKTWDGNNLPAVYEAQLSGKINVTYSINSVTWLNIKRGTPVSPVVMVRILLALLMPKLFLANMRRLYVEGFISMIVACVWWGPKSTTVFV